MIFPFHRCIGRVMKTDGKGSVKSCSLDEPASAPGVLERGKKIKEFMTKFDDSVPMLLALVAKLKM